MRDLPKVELHLHLEGAAPPDFVRGLAWARSIDISGIFVAEGRYAYDGFPGFLRDCEAATATMGTPTITRV